VKDKQTVASSGERESCDVMCATERVRVVWSRERKGSLVARVPAENYMVWKACFQILKHVLCAPKD